LDNEDIFSYRGRNDPNPYQQEHDELFKSIRNKGVISDTENGAYSTMTAIMGRMATYSGQVINWDEALKSDLQIMPAEVTWDTTPPTLPREEGNESTPKQRITNVM